MLSFSIIIVQEKHYSITTVYCADIFLVFLKLHENLVMAFPLPIIAPAFQAQDPMINLLPSSINLISTHHLHTLLSQALCSFSETTVNIKLCIKRATCAKCSGYLARTANITANCGAYSAALPQQHSIANLGLFFFF